MKHTFSIGGIHPDASKTAARRIVMQPLPMVAVVPLAQHIGAPARPVVAKGDTVSRGQLMAEGASFVSAGLHAPISGVVKAIDSVVMPDGKPTMAIIISASEADHQADTLARQQYWNAVDACDADRSLSGRLSPEQIRSCISDAGIVGLGGAAFPSHVKLSVKPGVKARLLVINGCECEPFLMCDDALMCRWPAHVIEGVELMMKAAGIPEAVIGIEDNKPQAIAALTSKLDPHSRISVVPLKTKYPQGGEKQLVEAVTGQRIASGELPLSVGVVVQNVATAFAVWQAVAKGQALIERVVTVTGDIPQEQRCNYIAAIGTPLSEFPFTLPDEARAIVGGPMMGRTAVCLDAPVTKATSGLTILSDTRRRPVEPCIRCGACVDACPMGLEPYLLATYGRLHMWDEARAADVADCLMCGACSYSCPSARPMLDFIRLAKQKSR